MATPKSQRIGIWIIAIVLMAGTFGSFLVMGLSLNNQKTDDSQLQTAYDKYQTSVAAQAKELSDKYYADFNQYASVPSEFSADSVTELTKNDLKVGDGADVTSETAYSAYYIGWNPKGVIFDQSIVDGTLKSPIAGGNMIAGWNEGVIDMRIGGVRELAIPSAKAYAETGSGENILPNMPIKFVVMIIPKVDEIPLPQILLDYYQSQAATQ